MYKIIACDLDETLLSDDRTISKENIEAIQKAKELGVKFVPATGRGFNTVGGTLKDLGLYDLENEYVISYNGGAITENKYFLLKVIKILLKIKEVSYFISKEFLLKKRENFTKEV